MRYVGGMVLLTHADGTVTGVDAASGKTKWSRPLPGVSSFVSLGGSPLAYATRVSDDGSTTQVTAIDPDTGDVRWKARLPGMLKPVGVHGGSVFFLSTDWNTGNTTAILRYAPGTKASNRAALPVPRQDAVATVRGNVVYVLATGGSLEAIDTDTHKRTWHLETSVSRGSVPVADARHVYVTAPDGRLLAVDAKHRATRRADGRPARRGLRAGGRHPARTRRSQQPRLRRRPRRHRLLRQLPYSGRLVAVVGPATRRAVPVEGTAQGLNEPCGSRSCGGSSEPVAGAAEREGTQPSLLTSRTAPRSALVAIAA